MIDILQDELDLAIRDAECRKASHRNLMNKWNGLASGEFERLPLTEDEKNKVIASIRSGKEFERITSEARAENRQRAKEASEKLRSEWDYTAFLKLMRTESWNRGVKLVENEDTLHLIKALCFRFSYNERYETELGYSFSKGLIVHGEPGLGKTYLFELIQNNPFNNLQIITMHDIVRSVVDTGDFKGQKWFTYNQILIDDVGTEYFGDNAIKRYGTDINWFKTFIENEYSKSKKTLSRVIITTNDSAEEIGNKYGFRVRDRLAEMFDVIRVTGKSFRR